jgi:hypothetical protein
MAMEQQKSGGSNRKTSEHIELSKHKRVVSKGNNGHDAH